MAPECPFCHGKLVLDCDPVFQVVSPVHVPSDRLHLEVKLVYKAELYCSDGCNYLVTGVIENPEATGMTFTSGVFIADQES
jgi:hypothetical protein